MGRSFLVKGKYLLLYKYLCDLFLRLFHMFILGGNILLIHIATFLFKYWDPDPMWSFILHYGSQKPMDLK